MPAQGQDDPSLVHDLHSLHLDERKEPVEKEAVLNLGWELCKIHEAPHIYVWLADRGWLAGAEIHAARHDPEHIEVHFHNWKNCILASGSPRGMLN